MNRRRFFSGMGGYSLVVLAGDSAHAQARPSFESIAPPASQTPYAPAEPHMSQVEMTADVVVAGGGMAGVCAAIAAARNGAKVVLVQDRSRLGGNSSSEVKMHVVGANAHKGRPGWRDSGILEELKLDDAAGNPQRSFELWDLLLYDKVVSDPNITLLLDSSLYFVRAGNHIIESVMVRCDKTEMLYQIRAKLFIDCTGDCRLGLEAGATLRHGREAKSEFNESLAYEQPDKMTQGSSILFTSRQYDRPMPFTPPRWARKVTKQQLRFRGTSSWEYGYWWIEWGGQLNTIRDNERIRFELLSIVLGVWDYIKNSGDHPESANWAMDWMGMIPGKRESRRMMGDHILTQQDLEGLNGDLEDAVAIGGWPMDDHPPNSFDRPDVPPSRTVLPKEVYSIPLRSLYSVNVKNLLMAGRNISASHVAFSSTRVMGTCSVMGQAAGTAAALCVRHKCLPRQLYQDKSRLKELQQTLLRDDQTIKNLPNQDPLDLARKAKITASSQRPEAQAELIADGFTRDIPKKEGHHWEGEMTAEGAWIGLAWDQSRRISQVQITFDTGFERELTLSAQTSANRGIIRGPQPETVKDYTVLCRTPGASEPRKLAAISGNHQRLNRHRFETIEALAIRIHVTATNGSPYARIFEIRCYA